MEIIYKGTLYEVPVIAPYTIDGARLYNLATQTYITTTLTFVSEENGNHNYTMTLTPEETASIPQGIYNLELFSMTPSGFPTIHAYYENYAKVKESSFTKDYA